MSSWFTWGALKTYECLLIAVKAWSWFPSEHSPSLWMPLSPATSCRSSGVLFPKCLCVSVVAPFWLPPCPELIQHWLSRSAWLWGRARSHTVPTWWIRRWGCSLQCLQAWHLEDGARHRLSLCFERHLMRTLERGLQSCLRKQHEPAKCAAWSDGQYSEAD